MNKDQAQGVAKDVAGKVQETVGQVTGSREQQAKGVIKLKPNVGLKFESARRATSRSTMTFDRPYGVTGFKGELSSRNASPPAP